MPILLVDSIDDPRLADYRDVGNPRQLRERGLFAAESRFVVRDLLSSTRFRTRSLLVTSTALASLEADASPQVEDLPVFVAPRDVMTGVVGYNVHRGCLALGERCDEELDDAWRTAVRSARLVIVLEDVGNPDNIGGVFRNAAAFGASAVALSPRCGDPLYRKAIRVSIGATLRVPYAIDRDWPQGLERLRSAGLSVAALTPDPSAVDIDAFASDHRGRIAVLAGCEGRGLSAAALAAADVRLRIPMMPGTDSLNVSVATAIALHRLMRPSGVLDGREGLDAS